MKKEKEKQIASFSRKGCGNGFGSHVDRFSGIKESKFLKNINSQTSPNQLN